MCHLGCLHILLHIPSFLQTKCSLDTYSCLFLLLLISSILFRHILVFSIVFSIFLEICFAYVFVLQTNCGFYCCFLHITGPMLAYFSFFQDKIGEGIDTKGCLKVLEQYSAVCRHFYHSILYKTLHPMLNKLYSFHSDTSGGGVIFQNLFISGDTNGVFCTTPNFKVKSFRVSLNFCGNLVSNYYTIFLLSVVDVCLNLALNLCVKQKCRS